MKNRGDLYKKIIHCLIKYPETRNSDLELTRKIWGEYYGHYLDWINDTTVIPLKNLNLVPTQDSIKRIRAMIQNDYHKFPPTNWKIAKKRGWEEIEWRKELGYGRSEGKGSYNKIIINLWIKKQ